MRRSQAIDELDLDRLAEAADGFSGAEIEQVVVAGLYHAMAAESRLTTNMLLDALRSQDMYLAGSFLMFLSLLTVVGMFLSDLALAVLDPRIRLQGGARR